MARFMEIRGSLFCRSGLFRHATATAGLEKIGTGLANCFGLNPFRSVFKLIGKKNSHGINSPGKSLTFMLHLSSFAAITTADN